GACGDVQRADPARIGALLSRSRGHDRQAAGADRGGVDGDQRRPRAGARGRCRARRASPRAGRAGGAGPARGQRPAAAVDRVMAVCGIEGSEMNHEWTRMDTNTDPAERDRNEVERSIFLTTDEHGWTRMPIQGWKRVEHFNLSTTDGRGCAMAGEA